MIRGIYLMHISCSWKKCCHYYVDWGRLMLLVTCACYLCRRHGNVGSRVTVPPVPARDTWHVSGVTQSHAVALRSQAWWRRAGTWAPGHLALGQSATTPRGSHCITCHQSHVSLSCACVILMPHHWFWAPYKIKTSVQCFSEGKMFCCNPYFLVKCL